MSLRVSHSGKGASGKSGAPRRFCFNVTSAATYDSGNFSLVENFYANGTGNGTTGGNANNRIGSRDAPRLVEAQGVVDPGNATVTVNAGATERVGDYWWARADQIPTRQP